MKLWWSAVMLIAACSVDIGYERTTLEFEPASPPKPGGGDSPMVASGTSILTNTHISWDDGASWREKNPAIDTQFPQIWNDENLLVFTTAFGWGRWVRTTDQVGAIDAPFAPAGIHLSKHTGSIVINAGGTRSMARQTAAGAWSQSTLPDPPVIPPTGFVLYDIVATPDAVFAITSWGLYRSGDDGASWGWVNDPGIPNALKFLVLPDNRVAILNGGFNQILDVFDANGTLQNISSPQFPTDTSNLAERFRPFSCLGAIIHRGRYSTDLGMTWKDLLPPITGGTWTVDRTTCGGSYIAIHTTAPVDWLLKMTELEKLDFLYTYTPKPGTGNVLSTDALRSPTGTVFSGGLAWKPGETTWRIRFFPPSVKIYALADGSLYGVDVVTVHRSTDDGATWTATMLPMAPPAFDRVFSSPDGTYWASQRAASTGGGNEFSAKLYKSTDKGLTWTTASEMAPRLAAIASDGTFVATTGGSGSQFHVSHDQGATWSTGEPFPSQYEFLMLTPKNNGVSYDINDLMREEDGVGDDFTRGAPSFHLWEDYGAGLAFEQVTPLVPALDPMTMEMTHLPADLSPVEQTMSVDAESYVWWYGGTPLEGAWRSLRPID